MSGSLFKIERWGTLLKAIRVVAWCLRFVRNSGKSCAKLSGELSYDELSEAKRHLFLCDQDKYFNPELAALRRGKPVPTTSSIAKLSPYLDKDGLLRVSGRLEFAALRFSEKHPIILYKSHLARLLVCFQHKLMKHAGVSLMLVGLRDDYWIVGVRRLAKSVRRECKSCKIQDAQACERPVAPLPSMRVRPAAPFSVIGIDHTGVLFCHDAPGKKFHILLVTCAVTRAVHLELVDSLSAQDVFLALRRMMARRGVSTIIYSDNAKAFKAAPELLNKHFGHVAPRWDYIAPRAPWRGGWWERLNKSLKSALRRSVGRLSLSRTELETVLHETEACINSRPLTFVGDELESASPLTPAHFLIGRCPFTPSCVQDTLFAADIERSDLLQFQEVRQEILDKFWVVWSTEYIRNLPPGSSSPSRGDITVGSVVMIREDNCPRLQWPVGLVIDVYPGKDGLVRTVRVKTSKGVFVRPIQRIHDLEVNDQSLLEVPESLSEGADLPDIPVVTRAKNKGQNIQNKEGPCDSDAWTTGLQKSSSGRKIKPLKRLDL